MLGLIGDAAPGSVVGDMCALPFCDDGFDAAVSGFAISHIDTPERALAEMLRVVRPRGQVIAAVFGERRRAHRRTPSMRSLGTSDSSARLVHAAQDAHRTPLEHARVARRLRNGRRPRGHRGRGLVIVNSGSIPPRRSPHTGPALRTSRPSLHPSPAQGATSSSSAQSALSASAVSRCDLVSWCSRVASPRSRETQCARVCRGGRRAGRDASPRAGFGTIA